MKAKKWAEVVSITENKKCIQMLVLKPGERSRRRWNNNIKVETKEIVLEFVNGIQLTSSWFQWRALLNILMSIQLA
jgi:hypothetical protein